ncbi:MAG: 4Fe-4S binding protein [Euryarchaeota archaeon]|nr:4Fe-4S binding protein [Euryarchaeota archaeon]
MNFSQTYVLAVDISRCMACFSCAMACAAFHSKGKSVTSAIDEGVKPAVIVFGDQRGALPIQCQHCEEAPCMMICPTGAISKEKNIIKINKANCIGCRLCYVICPFGAVKIVEGRAYKCDLCDGAPECVNACPTKALTYREEAEIAKDHRYKFFSEVIETYLKKRGVSYV